MCMSVMAIPLFSAEATQALVLAIMSYDLFNLHAFICIGSAEQISAKLNSTSLNSPDPHTRPTLATEKHLLILHALSVQELLSLQVSTSTASHHVHM